MAKHRARHFLAVIAGLLTLSAHSIRSQETVPKAELDRPAFAVATIRQNKTTTVFGQQRRLPGGGFTATSMSLRALIRLAYGNGSLVRPQDQILDGPKWIDSDRFDIEAKASSEFVPDPDGVTRQHLLMLRTLLEDRFKLKARMEKRELPMYALVLAKKDGSVGPDLKPSDVDCGPVAPPPGAAGGCGLSNDGSALVGRGIRLSALVNFLNISPAVGRIVQDKTGLTGSYDMRLSFVRPFNVGPGGVVPNPNAETGTSIFTALQEQLGLKLEPGKAPVDVVIIESVERIGEEK